MSNVIGKWLNGRVAVSKTVGWGFESSLPCQYNLDLALCKIFLYSIHNLEFIDK